MSNIVDLRIRNEIETEAAAWIVQLHGKKPTEKDLRALGDWMNRSPYHREAIGRLAAVWDDANALTALLEEAQHAPHRTPRLVWRVPRPLAAAFGAAAALGLALAGSYAQTPATVARGKDIAERVCAGCHAIDGRQGSTVMGADVPSFRALADRPYRTPESLQAYIMTPRHPMPAIPLELNEIRDVVDYIRSLN